jgi:hypothetical protein
MAKFKLHIQKNQSIKLTAYKTSKLFLFFYYTGLLVIKSFLGLYKILFAILYKLFRNFNLLISRIYRILTTEYRSTLQYFIVRQKVFLKNSSFYTILIFLCVSGLSFALIFSGKLIAVGLERKDEIMRLSNT